VDPVGRVIDDAKAWQLVRWSGSSWRTIDALRESAERFAIGWHPWPRSGRARVRSSPAQAIDAVLLVGSWYGQADDQGLSFGMLRENKKPVGVGSVHGLFFVWGWG
jgi:hypothetical protein